MPNRLIDETSPYLLQHAHNPVEWHAWGETAFAEARERDVPIFLSVGYSTCYWCHVMERESFEDEATARVMNERFVCVKLDREERPDVDDLYMTATQLMTGSGGWPMSVFLEPEGLRPFWCGTYFPREPMHGRPSFTQVLMGMSEVWAQRRDEAVGQAEQLAESVREHLSGDAGRAALGATQIASAVRSLLQIYDRTEGGFGGAPKFPQPVYARFLLAARGIVDDETRGAIDHCVRHTLDRMAVGGLFDQVGGGFHRYCVDGTWTVPHFEKMLYDNGQLLGLYAAASRVYDDAFYAQIARRTAGYLAREMTHADGGLFSAQDAEVDGREGLNYLWTEEQARAVLGDDADAAFADGLYAFGEGGNFTDPHHPEDGSKTVPRLEERPDRLAERSGVSFDEFEAQRARVNASLLAARDERKPPALDDKVIAAWNGMAIAGLVESGVSIGETAHVDAAERAARFVLGRMGREEGGLFRSFRDAGDGGRAAHDGTLEDLAWMAFALVLLHEAGRGDHAFLDAARSIAEAVHASFADDDGLYTDAASGRDDLFVRARGTYDGATPSAISVMIRALLVLHGADPAGPWLERARAQLGGISFAVAQRPVAAVHSVHAVVEFVGIEGGSEGLAFGEAVTPEGDRTESVSSASVVEIFADEESVIVGDDSPASVLLGFRIKPGYHILAADPVGEGSDATGLVPLRVGLVSGQGVAVYGDYPEGEAYGAGITGSDDLRVHGGEVRLSVAIEKQPGVGASEGDPVLGVTFQACDDSSCLKPATVRLGVAVRIE